MKIFLSDGRVGNQIFQYVFLKTIQVNNEKIIVSGFEELREVFELNDFININKNNLGLRVLLFKIFKPIISMLSDKNIISSITVKKEKLLDNCIRESTSYDTKQGILNRITYVKLGFFQSEVFFDKSFTSCCPISPAEPVTKNFNFTN